MSQPPATEASSEGRSDVLRTSVIYQRLQAMGLAGRVNCYFLHRNDGTTGSLIVDDRVGFVEALIATGRFCQDTRGGGMLHGGLTSLRESSPDSNQALHFTVGASDYVWVHTDSVSPNAGAKPDGHCVYESRRIARHIRRDVLRIRRDLESLLFSPPRGRRQGGQLRELSGE